MRYILLGVTWLSVLSIAIHTYYFKQELPNIWLFIILGVIALIPLAGRLKIGNWLDFTRKVENLGKEISSTQKEVNEVGSRLNAFIANVQSQQQVNIAVNSKEAAQAFAETILSMNKDVYPSSTTKEIISSDDEFFSDKMSAADRNRYYFISAADEALVSVTPLIRTLYAGIKTREQKKLISGETLYNKTLTSMIDEISPWKEVFGESPHGSGDVYDVLQKLFQRIKALVELREKVHQGSTSPPSVEEGRKFLADVYKAQAYLEGVISTLVSVLFVPEMRGPRIPSEPN